MEIKSYKENDVNTPYMSPCSSFSSYETCFSYLDDLSFDIDPDLGEKGSKDDKFNDQLENEIIVETLPTDTDFGTSTVPLQSKVEITENIQIPTGEDDLNKISEVVLNEITESIQISTGEDDLNKISEVVLNKITENIQISTGEDDLNKISEEVLNEITENIQISTGEDDKNEICKEVLNEGGAKNEMNNEGFIEEMEKIEPCKLESGMELNSDDNIETLIEEIEKFGNELIQSIGSKNDAKIELPETGSILNETNTCPSVVGTETEEQIVGGTETEPCKIIQSDFGTTGIETEPCKIIPSEFGTTGTETGTAPSLLEEIGTEPSEKENNFQKEPSEEQNISQSSFQEPLEEQNIPQNNYFQTEPSEEQSIPQNNYFQTELSEEQIIPQQNNFQKEPLQDQHFISKPLEPYHYEPIISTYRTDPDTWAPPIPAESKSDEENIFLSNSESEESSDSEDNISIDGIKLSKSMDFDEVQERQRAMLETLNGEFKELVRRFMQAEGFEVPAGDEGESERDSWRRVVRVLSWQAGLLVRPDAGSGKEMDPGLYVKVKCVASGSKTQSEVVNGLVFKKSASHKHMPTLIRNPRILLLKEVLGHSVAGLSSIRSMEQEKDVLEKSIMTMMETCKPDIILVEKTATREVQEILLKQGITVILDMKAHRMERIVRCTGSAVVSLDEALTRADVIKSCGTFRIERFESINKHCKNLLFLEGLPRPLGCTILLRGGNVEELKRIKRILNYTVFAAYHLILVTSFFADQRLFSNYKMALKGENSILAPKPSCLTSESSTASTASTLTQTDLDVHFTDAELPLCPSNNNNINNNINNNSINSEVPLCLDLTKPGLNGRKVEKHGSEKIRVNGNPTLDKEDSADPRSILIIVSSRNIAKRTICENSHISRINYYGTSDKTLGTHLQDILLNEKHRCATCGDPPASHAYVFTHKNGRLTVLVSSLPPRLDLSPPIPTAKNTKDRAKIWMWTRCLGCKRETGRAGPTERFVVSDAARNLSFGKFLELSFSSRLAEKRLACGHLLHRDGLRFFGMGTKVAMFRYSPVALFNACKPPSMLDFRNPRVQDWLQKETLDVAEKRALLFSEVERIAQDLKERCSDPDFLKEISHDSLLLTQERAQLEVSLTNKNDPPNNNSNAPTKLNINIQDVLSLNWLYQTLFLETYMWDQRLNHLIQFLPNRKTPPPFPTNHKNPQNPNQTDKDTNSDEETNLEIIQVPELQKSESVSESESKSVLSLDVTNSKAQDKDAWIWAPFNNVLMAYKKELQVGFLERFQLINKYTPSILKIQNQQNRELDSRFYVGPGGNVFSVSEDEVSSLIAYALCISEENRKNEEETKGPVLDTSILLSATSSISSDEFLSISKDLHPEISLKRSDINNFLSLKGKYSITCVYARQFYDLRRKCCPSEIAYITSLSRCKKWNAQGGKSKVFFAKTMDERFIIKQIKRTEFDSFLQFAPDYFKYVSESVERGNPTCLAKILGIYQVCEVRNGKEIRMDLMVMENLLFGRNVSRTYDLKGAMFARHVADSDLSAEGQAGKVFLDQNFIEDMRASPIYLGQKTKKVLERALWNDTSFLTAINVMDYSLLVGVDRENRTLIFGIIDYLRQYTWDKQLETWVKSSLVVPKNELPTVISPKEYKKRFRKFMQLQILSVPEGWGEN